MILVILAFGILCEMIIVWFIEDKLAFSLGLSIGILLAMLATIHMWWALDKAMGLEASAQKIVLTHNMLRYGIILVVFVIICMTDFINPLAAFLGIMSLKVGAYLQPFTDKIFHK